MLKGKKISVIVPVFNEEKTVAGVVASLLTGEFIDEIICINDGSTDRSGQILRVFGKKIRLIEFPENKGKSYAMAEGVLKAKGEIIVFCDSDLIGITPDHIRQLVLPLLEGKADYVLGGRGKRFNPLDLLTGERAYWRKDLLSLVEKFRHTQFGVETFLNHAFRKKKRLIVRMKGYKHLLKTEKMPTDEAFRDLLKESLEVVAEYARVNGLSSRDFRLQLRKLKKATSWRQLYQKIKEIGNKDVREVFEEYLLVYLKKLRTYFEEEIT